MAKIKDKTNKYVVSKRTADELWKSLDEDRSIFPLTLIPEKELLSFLQKKLKPMKLTKDRAKKLLADLGDETFTVAEAAFEELSYFDPRLAFTPEEIFNDLPEGIQRQRIAAFFLNKSIDELLGCTIAYHSGASSQGQTDRAVTSKLIVSNVADCFSRHSSVAESVANVFWRDSSRCEVGIVLLEHLGTPAVVKLLEAMATGHPDASPTDRAKDALERLKKR